MVIGERPETISVGEREELVHRVFVLEREGVGDRKKENRSDQLIDCVRRERRKNRSDDCVMERERKIVDR